MVVVKKNIHKNKTLYFLVGLIQEVFWFSIQITGGREMGTTIFLRPALHEAWRRKNKSTQSDTRQNYIFSRDSQAQNVPGLNASCSHHIKVLHMSRILVKLICVSKTSAFQTGSSNHVVAMGGVTKGRGIGD